jgi:hypothetical protein
MTRQALAGISFAFLAPVIFYSGALDARQIGSLPGGARGLSRAAVALRRGSIAALAVCSWAASAARSKAAA